MDVEIRRIIFVHVEYVVRLIANEEKILFSAKTIGECRKFCKKNGHTIKLVNNKTKWYH